MLTFPISDSFIQILLKSVDKLPKSSSPTGTNGTIQQTFGSIPTPSIYNAHGVVTPNNPNSLIARV